MSDETLQILVRVTNNLQPWWNTIVLGGYFLGFCLFVGGLLMMASQDQSMMRRKMELAAPIMAMLAGLFLINLLPFLDVISMSTFGTESMKELSYTADTSDGIKQVMLYFSVTVTMLVGLAGVINGSRLLAQSGRDSQKLWPALAHLIGGFFAVNIGLLFELAGNTIGGSTGSTIANLLS